MRRIILASVSLFSLVAVSSPVLGQSVTGHSGAAAFPGAGGTVAVPYGNGTETWADIAARTRWNHNPADRSPPATVQTPAPGGSGTQAQAQTQGAAARAGAGAGAVSGSSSGVTNNVGGGDIGGSVAIGLSTPYCGNGGGGGGGNGGWNILAVFNWMDRDCKVIQATDRHIVLYRITGDPTDLAMARGLLRTLPRAEQVYAAIPVPVPVPVVAAAPIGPYGPGVVASDLVHNVNDHLVDRPHTQRRGARRSGLSQTPAACPPSCR